MERMYATPEDSFINNLPNSLYLNAYELSAQYGHTAKEWKEYLKNPETKRLIEREVAEMAEAAARNAIKNLGDKPSSSDIQAAKQLLENSKLLQQKNQSQHTIVMTYLPPRSEELQEEKPEPSIFDEPDDGWEPRSIFDKPEPPEPPEEDLDDKINSFFKRRD